MSKDKLEDFDTVEGNNTDLGGTSTLGTNNASAFDNLFRRLMAYIKDYIGDVTATELGYLDGARSSIQTQLDGFQDKFEIEASVASSALTVALKNTDGTDPDAADPIEFTFRNATATDGGISNISLTAANSLVISSGSTLGASSGTAFRLWLVAFNDAGTLKLGLVNCLDGVNIYPLSETGLESSTAEGGAGGADSAHVIYTTVAASSVPMIVLGRLEWDSGLTTAGTWDAVPTRIVPFRYDRKLPGDIVQTKRNTTAGSGTNTTSTVSNITNAETAITAKSVHNMLEIDGNGDFHVSTPGASKNIYYYAVLARGTTEMRNSRIGVGSGSGLAAETFAGYQLKVWEKVTSSSAVTYRMRHYIDGTAGFSSTGTADDVYVYVKEVMA